MNAAVGGPESFGEEIVWNYELGLKSDWFDRRFRLNASVFTMDLSDVVVQSFGTGVNNTTAFFLRNSDSAEVRGLELEATMNPVPDLIIKANLGLLDKDFKDFGIDSSGTPIDPSRANFFDSPSRTTSIIADYTIPSIILPRSFGFVTTSLDWSQRSNTFFDNNFTFASNQPRYDITNFRLTYSPPSEEWNLRFYAENLFDQTYLVRTFNVTGTPLGFSSAIFGDPRQLGFTFGLRI